MNEKHDEKWLLSKGWTKVDGYKVCYEELGEGEFDIEFFSELPEGITKSVFYESPKDDDYASDDLNECIEMQEEAEQARKKK